MPQETWFVNVGMDQPTQPLTFEQAKPYNRHWELCRKHGYLCAGGGPVYSRPFHRLEVGDELFAYQKQAGYVGHGIVTSRAFPAHYLVLASGQRLVDALQWPGLNPPEQNPDSWEHAIGVEWKKTFAIPDAQTFGGIFAARQTACRLRQPETLRFLRERFN